MERKSETSAYVQKFLADMDGMERPNLFRADNGGEFISRDYVNYCDPAGIRREYTPRGSRSRSRLSRVRFGALRRAAMRRVSRLDDCPRASTSPKFRSSAKMATVYGSRLSCGLPTALTAPRPRRTSSGGHRTRFYPGDCRTCRWCLFSIQA